MLPGSTRPDWPAMRRADDDERGVALGGELVQRVRRRHAGDGVLRHRGIAEAVKQCHGVRAQRGAERLVRHP